jgi:hypothetical protein
VAELWEQIMSVLVPLAFTFRCIYYVLRVLKLST